MPRRGELGGGSRPHPRGTERKEAGHGEYSGRRAARGVPAHTPVGRVHEECTKPCFPGKCSWRNFARESFSERQPEACHMTGARRPRGRQAEEEEDRKTAAEEQTYLAMSVAVLRQACAEAGLESTG